MDNFNFIFISSFIDFKILKIILTNKIFHSIFFIGFKNYPSFKNFNEIQIKQIK